MDGGEGSYEKSFLISFSSELCGKNNYKQKKDKYVIFLIIYLFRFLTGSDPNAHCYDEDNKVRLKTTISHYSFVITLHCCFC